MNIKANKRKGFTLIELALVISIGILIAGASLMMLNQQITLQQWTKTQNFIIKDAPVINTITTKIINKATAYRLHESLDDALNGVGGVNTNAKAIVIVNSNNNNETRFAVIYLDTSNGESKLKYHNVDNDFTWTISNTVTDVNFSVDNNKLILQYTGPNNEVIEYGTANNY